MLELRRLMKIMDTGLVYVKKPSTVVECQGSLI